MHVAGAFGAELIDARSLDQFLAVNSDVALGDVIAEDENEIGFAVGGLEKSKAKNSVLSERVKEAIRQSGDTNAEKIRKAPR